MLKIREVVKASLAVFCLLAALAGGALLQAQSSGALAGKWNMVSTTPDGDDIPWTLTIKYEGGKYSATVDSPHGDMPAKEFSADETNIRLKVDYEDQDYQIKLKTAGTDKLSGTWEGSNQSGTTKGTRSTTP